MRREFNKMHRAGLANEDATFITSNRLNVTAASYRGPGTSMVQHFNLTAKRRSKASKNNQLYTVTNFHKKKNITRSDYTTKKRKHQNKINLNIPYHLFNRARTTIKQYRYRSRATTYMREAIENTCSPQEFAAWGQ